MQDIVKVGGSNVQSVEAEMRIKYDTNNSIHLGVAAVRDLVVYAIHHYSTVRNYAFQALVDCGYVEEVTDKKEAER